MAAATNKKDLALIQRFEEHCAQIRQHTTVKSNETEKDRQARIKRAKQDYGYFVEYYFPHYAKVPSAKFQIEEANRIRDNPQLRAVQKWARGHSKSVTFDVIVPMWLKIQDDPALRFKVMVLVGKSEDNADTLLSDLQAELENNQRYLKDFGEQMSMGSWEDGEFVTRDGTAFFARGRGQSPRGLRYREHRPDLIVIDDLDDDELVQNEKRVRILTDWVLEALFGSMDMGRGRFIMVGNLIGKKSVLAAMCERPGMYVRQVDALDKRGRPNWPEKYTVADIDKVRQLQGERRFQKEYMNNPITEGAVFKNTWIRWKDPLPLAKYEHLVCYCDPSFKSTSANDYKAIKLWGKIGTELHHLKAFVRQGTVSEMVRWFYDLHESLPEGVTVEYWMELVFMQDLILDEFRTEGDLRGYQLPIRGDTRKKPDKFQRIEAVSPLWERGFVFYSATQERDPDMLAGIEQTLAIEPGSRMPDDAPDADEGAIWLLQRRTRQSNFGPAIIGRRERKGR
jgi:hypothetical protein